MILVNIKGGIGNQLFQYAAARAVSIKTEQVLRLDIADATRHNNVDATPRRISILDLNISAAPASSEERNRIRYPYGAVSKLFSRIQAKFFPNDVLNFDETVLENKDLDQFIDGYYQSYKYFLSIENLIRDEFTLTKPSTSYLTWRDRITDIEDTVSIHIRRGDYISKPSVRESFGPCTLTYFNSAIANILNPLPNATFVLFSDDPDWVEENLEIPNNNQRVTISGNNLTDVEELLLMKECDHNIISNSSFSWWGAWLNNNSEKIVYYPTPWLNDGKIHENDLIPPTWKALPKK